MNFSEIKKILFRLFNTYVNKHLNAAGTIYQSTTEK